MFKHVTSFGLFILLFTVNLVVQAQTFPPGFSQVKVSSVNYPVAMTFAPDSRIFVCEKAGRVRIIKNGAMLPTPFLQVTVNTMNERGLDGIVLDPDFNTNQYVYIFYTVGTGTIHNRLSRFTANGDVAVAGSERILIDFEPVVNAIHNGGGMVFGPDGKLYLSIGDDHVSANAQDMTTYKGKVLRLNKDGSAPSDNPFTGSEVARRVWALGFRNPYTMAVQQGTGKIYVNDVGEGSWEEINDVTQPGKNFGWPHVEGKGTNPAYVNPFYAYAHWGTGTSGGCAVSGGGFINGPTSNYPTEYTGKYFFSDYCDTWLNYLNADGTKVNFSTGMPSSRVVVQFGPDGNLYYFSLNTSSLYKIIYTNEQAPEITTQPDDKTVPEGQAVSFSVSASGATPLSYQWKRNNIDIAGATSATYSISQVKASDAANYNVRVYNTFGSVISNPAILTVTAFNAAPLASISAPVNGSLYRAGDVINITGNGTDNEDGTLPASAFSWWVDFHHEVHSHPGPQLPQGVKTCSFTIPVTGEPAANVYFRIILVVKDSKGLADTTFVDIKPKTSTLSLATEPSGLKLTLDGQPKTTPYSVLAVSGMIRNIGVVASQQMNNVTYEFQYWKHGGNATQDIHVTDNNAVYTAVFKSVAGCTASGTILREFWNYTGTTLSGIPVSTTPGGTSQLTLFEGPANKSDYYGSRIRGYICPPTTGSYTFWIASDNNSELRLSSDENPNNKVKIASVSSYTKWREWTRFPEQKSVTIQLTAGKRYYIEALHREGNQGDHLAVGWTLPNGSNERPIPGNRLSPFAPSSNNPPSVIITNPKSNESFSTPVNITVRVTATDTDGTISKVVFYEGTNVLGEIMQSPYNFGWNNVTTGNYYLKAVAYDDKGAVSNSLVVPITVTGCTTPTITPGGPTTFCQGGSVVLQANTGAGITYNWRKDGVYISGATQDQYTATTAGDYQIKTVQGSCVAWSAPLKVTVNNCARKAQDPVPESDISHITDKESMDNLMVNLFPNPTTGVFTLEMNMGTTFGKTMHIQIVNTMGQLVFSKKENILNDHYSTRIELEKSLPSGMYILLMELDGRVEKTRLMLSR